MGTCSVCGQTALTRECNHCGTTTCSDHILPENHDCIALNAPDTALGGDTATSDDPPGREQQTLGTTAESTSSPPTVGASKQPPVESSPDVALDGSIDGETTADEQSADEQATTSQGGVGTAAANAVHRLVSARAVVVLVIAVVLMPGVVVDPGTIVSHVSGIGSTDSGTSGAPLVNGTEQGATASEGDANRAGLYSFNLSLTEQYFVTYLNEERASRGLQNVSHRRALTEMGHNHSRDMADRDYFNHTQPDGDTIRDRYAERGLLPECRLSRADGTYYPGAENIAQTYVNEDLSVDWTTGTYRVQDEDDLAYSLFQMWMHSEGHREAMLVSSADEAGLGLYIEHTGKVYASLELC